MNALAVLATLATAAAAVGLWVGARRHRATVARGYRWLSGAALFWCAGLVMQLVMARSLGSSAAPSLADVAPLLALAAIAVGIMVLASPGPATDPGAGNTETAPAAAGGSILPGSVLPGLADGYVTAVSLLVVGWTVAFGTEYHNSGERPAIFLLDLLHPLADLAVLGALLPVLTVAWQRALLPYLSLLAATGADSLGVGARISGGHEGVLEQLAIIAAAALLGVSPWAGTLARRYHLIPWRPDEAPSPPAVSMLGAPVADPLAETYAEADSARQPTSAGQVQPTGQAQPAAQAQSAGRARPASQAQPAKRVHPIDQARPAMVTGAGVATIIAAITAAVAAVVVIVNGLASAPASGLALVIAGGAAVLVVAVRVLMLVRENGVAVRMWQRSGGSLRDLASRTSDLVMICDLDGTIAYARAGRAARPREQDPPSASRNIAFSCPPTQLEGKRLAELLHPEDVPVARSVIRQALGLVDEMDPLSLPESAVVAAAGQPAGLAEDTEAADGRFSCRVRAVDGSWRHLDCAVLLYEVPGEPDRMLVAARDVSDEVALRNQVGHLTYHDGLTGLPNRAYMQERARAILAEGSEAISGVIFLDLDGFTGVNDSAGHGAGDLVLAQAARRLRAAVPARDTVARWGSDEFAVLVENAAGVAEITELAELVARAIAGTPFKVADQDIALTASVGAAVAIGGDRSPDLLLRNADVAMSQAKAAGGDRAEVFAEQMHTDVVRRMQLASDLKRALDRDELTVVYQPIVELATSRVIGAEALVRWHRDGADADPREFLAVAEDTGLGSALGEFVLRTACEQAARWRADNWDVMMAVNLSPRQLTAPRFPAELADVLAETGLPSSALAVEVNERILVEGADRVISRLAELRELGVRLAIDDFGTGYASLAYLRELPVDIIKVDPSFVSGLGTDPTLTLLTKTIVAVGRDLGIEVVAEGIEQQRQLTELVEMGCGLGQGFALARPMAASGVEAMLGADPNQPARPRVSKAGAA
ncbi:MAG TPA: sensor domain-containing phosphodiesterase [Trebonia sp.]|nr:sensor domain-containing phosphodiesterase [Trebonia sp.]